jgi:Polysaccharide pyruvyl transferase
MILIGTTLNSIAQRSRGLRHLRLLLPANRAFYVGWIGHSNMGDEGMLEATKRMFPGVDLAVLPKNAVSVLERMSHRSIAHAAVIGGGTLIGHGYFRTRLESWKRNHPELPIGIFGTGVEDPSFSVESGMDTAAELERWVDILHSASHVSVRGPRSQQILRDFGIDAEVAGDPGLLLKPESSRADDTILGLNFGVSRAAWGGDVWSRVEDMLVEVGRNFVRKGWSVHCFPLWAPDVPHVRRLAGRIGSHAEVFDRWSELDALLDALARCHVFIGVKLHSVVFASAAGVPSIALEYQPKCRDFQRSIGRGAFTFRTDRANVADLLDALDELLANHSLHTESLTAAVEEKRQALGRSAELIHDLVRGAQDSRDRDAARRPRRASSA